MGLLTTLSVRDDGCRDGGGRDGAKLLRVDYKGRERPLLVAEETKTMRF